MAKFTAEQIYNLLIKQKISDYEGGIKFELMGITIDVSDKSSIGYLFQEWLARWFEFNNIDFRVKSNSQEFPDFLLDSDSDQKDLLEVKVFDSQNSPNFDVANFQSYCRSLKKQSYRVDADYLIFSYNLVNSRLKITNVWLKKIWEITGPSEAYPIRTQVKQGMIYNIRPIIWFSQRSKFRPFGSKERFLAAIQETLMLYPQTTTESQDWLSEVSNNYNSLSTARDLANEILD